MSSKMMSSDITEKTRVRNKLIEKLSCASTSFELKLPFPVGSIYRRALDQRGVKCSAPVKTTQSEQSTSWCSDGETLKRLYPLIQHKEFDYISFAEESYRPFIICDKQAIQWRIKMLKNIKVPLPAVKMPLISLGELKDHLHAKFGFKTTKDFTVTITEDSLHQSQAEIESFIAEVERTRVLAISIAGYNPDVEMPRWSEIKTEELEMSFVAFSGVILKFRDVLLLPKQLRNILGDVCYAKLSNCPNRDCLYLEKFRIRLRGWVHGGAVYCALLNTKSKFDIQTQAKFLVDHQYVGASQHSLIETTYPDIGQDFSWVPLAITLASAINFAVKRGYPDSKQIFPVVWEAIDLVRLRVPEDLDKLSDDPVMNWMVGVPGCVEEEHRNVNHVMLMQWYRKMSADFVEVFDPASNPIEVAMHSYELFFGPKIKRWIQPARCSKKRNRALSLEGRCNNCADLNHTVHTCPELRGKSPVCDYPHDNVTALPPHSTQFCPLLHHHCHICSTKGHYPSLHLKRSHTLRELRERFFRHAHVGFLTSLPFLVLLPDVRPKISRTQFRAGYLGLNFAQDPITRYQLGIGHSECAPFCEPQKGCTASGRQFLSKLNDEADNPEDRGHNRRHLRVVLWQRKEKLKNREFLMKRQEKRLRSPKNL